MISITPVNYGKTSIITVTPVTNNKLRQPRDGRAKRFAHKCLPFGATISCFYILLFYASYSNTSIITVPPVGIDKLWIIGDQFVSNNIQQYFLSAPQTDSYCRSQLEVCVFHKGNTADRSDSPISRIVNNLIYAMKTKGYLPKIIAVILEDDLIRYVDYNDFGVTSVYGQIFNYIIEEVRSAIIEFKYGILPVKARRDAYPQIIWFLPTLHCNYHPSDNTLRKKLIGEMENQIKYQTQMHTVHVNTTWTYDNLNLVNKYEHRMSPLGLAKFWNDFDNKIAYANQNYKDLTGKMRKPSIQVAEPQMETTVFNNGLRRQQRRDSYEEGRHAGRREFA